VREVLHQHNEALQIIDSKIKRLVQTMDYLSESNKGNGGSVFSENLDYVFNQIKSLKKSRDLLISFDGGNEAELFI